jgi:hypothetical protein
MEMRLLEWIGKPVIVLLNQLGPPRERALEQRDLALWESAVGTFSVVRATLALDAFARCWVQEQRLLDTIGGCLPEAKRAAHATLTRAWQQRNLAVFRRSMEVLAVHVARAARDREAVAVESWGEKLRGAVAPVLGSEAKSTRERAMLALATRLDGAIVESTNELIGLHRLEGEAAAEILERMRENFTAKAPLDTGVAAIAGGFVSGALGGLVADLAAGGLTFGGGAVAGGLLGAAGAAGLAKGYNLVRGAETAAVRWSPEFLSSLAEAALLRYLAVAHFGRGRGRWQESEAPRFWKEEVEAVIEAVRSPLERAIRQAEEANGIGSDALADALESIGRAVLLRLYPDADAAFERAPGAAR